MQPNGMLLGFLTLFVGLLAVQGSVPRGLVSEWRLTGLEMAGHVFPEADVPKLTVTIDAAGRWLDSDGAKATLTVDDSKTPRWVDISYTAGPNQSGRRQTFGIYELAGNRLRIAFAQSGPGASRPARFETKKGSDVSVLTLQKVSK